MTPLPHWTPPKSPQQTRTDAIHTPLNQAQAYINAVIEELETNYPSLRTYPVRLNAVTVLIDQIQHDFEDKMLTEEAGC